MEHTKNPCEINMRMLRVYIWHSIKTLCAFHVTYMMSCVVKVKQNVLVSCPQNLPENRSFGSFYKNEMKCEWFLKWILTVLHGWHLRERECPLPQVTRSTHTVNDWSYSSYLNNMWPNTTTDTSCLFLKKIFCNI